MSKEIEYILESMVLMVQKINTLQDISYSPLHILVMLVKHFVICKFAFICFQNLSRKMFINSAYPKINDKIICTATHLLDKKIINIYEISLIFV